MNTLAIVGIADIANEGYINMKRRARTGDMLINGVTVIGVGGKAMEVEVTMLVTDDPAMTDDLATGMLKEMYDAKNYDVPAHRAYWLPLDRFEECVLSHDDKLSEALFPLLVEQFKMRTPVRRAIEKTIAKGGELGEMLAALVKEVK